MGIEIPIVKTSIDILLSVLKGVKRKLSEKGEERQAKQFISEAYSELLGYRPDRLKVSLLIKKAEKLLPKLNEDLERARDMLERMDEASSP